MLPLSTSILITFSLWAFVYLLVGWSVARDEQPKRRLLYTFGWGLAVLVIRLYGKYNKSTSKRKPRIIRLDETNPVP